MLPVFYVQRFYQLYLVTRRLILSQVRDTGSKLGDILSELFFFKGLEASQLFSRSQDAISETESAYKDMESEWNEAKKSLDLSLRQTTKALALLNDINGQQIATHEKLLKLVIFI